MIQSAVWYAPVSFRLKRAHELCPLFICMQDKDGVLWRDKLVASARKEFEDARYERDPDIIARLLIGGQDALIAITDRMLNKARKLVDEEKTSPPGLGDGWAHANAGGDCRTSQYMVAPFLSRSLDCVCARALSYSLFCNTLRYITYWPRLFVACHREEEPSHLPADSSRPCDRAAVGMGEMQSQQQGGAIPYGSARRSPPGERLGGKFGDRAPPHGVKEGKIADEIAWKRDWERRHNIQGAGARNDNSPPSWLPKAKSPWTFD